MTAQNNFRITKQSGIGLLEVMIAVAVLSIALLSLAGLHSMIIKSSSLAKSRAIAMSIAQEKLDDLRSFENLVGEIGNASTLYGFDEIDDNLGGKESAADETLQLPQITTASPLVVGNVAYTRAWSVECFYYGAPDDEAAATAAACPTYPVTAANPRPAFKRVTVAITWKDPIAPDETQSIALQAVIAPFSPSTTGQAGLGGGDFDPPVVKYTPGVAPDIIRIDVGGGSYKEAGKPQPELQHQGASTITSFDEVTYNNYITTADTLTRDSYFTVNCTCAFAGVGEAYKPTVYDAAEDKFIVGDKISKMTGVPADNQQPDVCTICCRDHHDSTQPPSSYSSYEDYNQVYDPFRSRDDYISSSPGSNKNHKHYFDTSNNNTTLEAKSETTGQEYYEACKMVRVDGFLRVAQDWRMESLQVIPGPKLDETNEISAFTTYVRDFVKAYVLGINPSEYPQTTPDPSTSTAAFDWEPSNLAQPYYSMISGADQNFVARAIYMDYISPEQLDILKCKINDNGYTATTQYCIDNNVQADTNWLQYTPFHEVNVTRLAAWEAAPNTAADGTGATVDTANGNGFNDAITQQNQTDYVRGRVHMLEDGHAVVKVSIKRSNTGLLPPQIAIDDKVTNGPPDTWSDAAYLEDKIYINAENIQPKIKITGTISATPNSVNLSGPEQLSVVGSNGAICNPPVKGNGNTASYSCTLDATPGVGTITFGNFTGTNTTCTGTGQNKVCTSTVDYDNCLVHSGITPTSASPGGVDATSSETAIYTFTGIASDSTFDIEVKHEPNASCNP